MKYKAALLMATAAILHSIPHAAAQVSVSYVSPTGDVTEGPGQTLIGVREGLEEMDPSIRFFSSVPPAHNDPAAFDRILSDQVVLAPTYLMVTPATAMVDIYDRLNEATAKGVKLILFAPPIGLDEHPIDPLTYIIVPEDEMGRMAGRDIAEMACEQGRSPINLAMFHGIPTSEIGNLRSEGFLTTLREELETCDIPLNVLVEEYTNFSREMAFNTVEPVMTAHPEINVIFGANSNTALGVMEGLQATGIQPGADGIWIAGQGGQLDELAAVCRGEIMTVPFRDPRRMADVALEIVQMDIDGRSADIEPVYQTQLSPIRTCDDVFATVPREMLESRGFRPLIPEELWQD
ncbi:sugar ABC transporter substrate-binding protein [Nitratireductor sp. GCM10026969]|uniref:sugar ABC transporter substrate-binding protein n=1 Tax=Nitratireductor sp. GCM10026969 TaxID=3252645 RepID=UPI00360BBE79